MSDTLTGVTCPAQSTVLVSKEGRAYTCQVGQWVELKGTGSVMMPSKQICRWAVFGGFCDRCFAGYLLDGNLL